MTEWGSMALIDEGQGDKNGKSISLPGVRAGDMSSRQWKPEVRVSSIQFSPTGESLDYCLSSNVRLTLVTNSLGNKMFTKS